MEKPGENFSAVKVKKEKPDEDINEYAETAMNELLGWYGYGINRDAAAGKLPGPSSCNSQRESNSPDNTESPKYTDGCEWCGKAVDETKGLSSSASGAVFCSELCFSQSRRANFKKNKTCDWCRHIRHTISYVDFQDGASQLQFCSTKCLNQYKMHIFCRETRAHLEMHPHIPDDSGTPKGNLITPDLWLRNCKSPEPCDSPPSKSPSPRISDNQPQTSPLPLLTIAHPSKLMDTSRLRSKVQRKPRKRCRSTATTCSPSPVADIPQDLRVRHTPPYLNEVPDESRFIRKNFMEQFCSPQYNGYPSRPHPELMYCQSAPHPPPIPPPLQPPQATSLLPPVTVLVPYPIILPIPLPIPIPIPLSREDFERLVGSSDKNEKQKGRDEPEVKDTPKCVETDDKKTSLDETPNLEVPAKPLRKRRRVVCESKSKVEPAVQNNKKDMPT